MGHHDVDERGNANTVSIDGNERSITDSALSVTAIIATIITISRKQVADDMITASVATD